MINVNDLKILTAQPQPIVLGDETYMAHPLTVDDWGEVQAWLDAQHKNPFTVVKAAIAEGGFSMAIQQYMINQALDRATKPTCRIGSPEADELLTSMQGYAQILYISIRKGRPEFTVKDAAELAMKLTAIDMVEIGQATTLNMMASDPKDEPLDVKPPLKKSGPAASRSRTRAAKKTGG